ncbi:polysaccharide lyase 6 family protein [Fulvivirgaceae bacterium BMA12]|uniref:Polysaccharide lyase 6 family protein n=1 Tax=Agaribacillus aureus TaxID=3051825 RepID=A0ABT8LAX3_9BACT|nr:polysaccharide lyase 6 family protein [Fulvivirgaceae bacterium BMA12]
MKDLIRIQMIILAFAWSLNACDHPSGHQVLVHDLMEFEKAVQAAQPGDVISLANGVWSDTELLFEANGTAEKPVTLTAEEKGRVFLEGASNLRIAGEHLVVSGLVFRNGFTPTNEVISFKKDKKNLANHCRVSECVIDNFSNPERFETDTWVAIYGKNNRFDHNYLTGKRNHGVTLAVRLNSEESRENDHLIDHNYFGPRPNLGANGGETLRIGTSHYSLTNSRTVVEYNYFDRCNGEHEIISNKSCQNTYRDNTFFECRGTLTMRHGNETTVDGNFFFGNGKVNTGGIRIINEKQTVTNNYFYDLTGYRFRGALVIMNGVPNSPLNRYFQVKESVASNNTFINCDHVQLCAGSDEERSAVPVSTSVANNVFYHENKADIFTIYDDISGINFEGNFSSPDIDTNPLTGIKSTPLKLVKNASGLVMPHGQTGEAGTNRKAVRATPENTGVSWYPRVDESIRFGVGSTVMVEPGMNTLYEAVRNTAPGDVLVLNGSADYHLTKSLSIHHPLTIKSGAASRPVIKFEKTTLFYIENGGSLALQGIIVDGSESPDAPGNAVMSTSRYSMNKNYKLRIEDSEFKNLDINHSFDVLKIYKNTFADSIYLRNTAFSNITGSVLALDKETDDIGIYNAENVDIENCTFSKIQGLVLDLYRGGKDESTFGPILTINHCVFNEVGHGTRNRHDAAIRLHGAQVAYIKNSIFTKSNNIELFLAVGEPIISITNCNFHESGKIIANDEAYQTSGLTRLKPDFENTAGFALAASSGLIGKADDGTDIGIIKN